MRAGTQDPFADMTRLRARLRELLDAAYPFAAPAPPSATWTPPADIVAHSDMVVVEMELCEVGREDIDITLQGNVMTVSGTRMRRAGAGEEYHLAQRPCGRFARSFSLGFAPASVEAAVSDGVLTIALRRP